MPPRDKEIRMAAKNSHSGRTGGATGMRAEDLKRWLRGIEREEKALAEGEEGQQGAGDA